MASTHPAVIIVPGAWSPPAFYEDFAAKLRSGGYATKILTLPSCNSSSPESESCPKDVGVVRKQVVTLLDEEQKDVLMICHSFGGIVGGAAAHGLSKVARSKEGKSTGIVGLVYVSGLLIPAGVSMLQAFGGNLADYAVINEPAEHQVAIKGAKDVFFNDLDDVEGEKWAKTLGMQSMRAFDSANPQTAWSEPDFAGRLAYIRCINDQAMPLQFQDSLMQMTAVEWKVSDIDTGHFPFVSKSGELAEKVEVFGDGFGQTATTEHLYEQGMADFDHLIARNFFPTHDY
ncbi:uncharacterized protein KY384_001336 [Bacidia gigantensis]|uniref:uncharacterized protein n=1 Tax=Bacidia gigantensis TaxID=2732470 RepID=UPI001D041D1B|nr:uncharacterized protein KY384_001336 [Bacidia gigantensis]KAG8533596.1 hypothetical protein KY384_001336 [Bacidia gigantensis]